jgi:hypothetical protein
LTNTPDRPGWVQGLVLAAILTWIVTATWFISAVSGIDPIEKLHDAGVTAWNAIRRTGAPGVAVEEEPALTPLQRAQADRLAIDKQLNSAYSWTLLAILLTIAALIGGLISSVAPRHITAGACPVGVPFLRDCVGRDAEFSFELEGFVLAGRE